MGGQLRKRPAVVVVVLLALATVACEPLARHPDNGPYEIDILALGDSFTAGNGARVSGQEDYGYYGISADDPRPDESVRTKDWNISHPYGCFRNSNNYSFELYDAIGSAGAYVNAACSGDTTDNVVAAAPPEAQLAGFSEAQRKEFDLVTLTIGGNDLHFAAIMQQCLVGFADSAVECQANFDNAFSQLDGSPSLVYTKMRHAVVRVAQDFPNARIVLLGYPLIYEDENYTVSDGDVHVQPGRLLEEGLNQLNDQQRALIEELNPQYERRLTFMPLHEEDGSGLFDGHGLEGGPDADWINPAGSQADLPYREEWFHINSTGHAAIAQALGRLRPVRNLAGGLERVSVATGTTATLRGINSLTPSISDDGRYVAFMTEADLVAGDTNGVRDAFVHDRATQTTERVSLASDGTQPDGNPQRYRGEFGASISGDGRYVAFVSDATNLVVNDWNATDDVFVHDRTTGLTERVSVASDGTEANSFSVRTPVMSPDGRYVAFWSYASNLVADDTNACMSWGPICPDVFVHDRETGVTERVAIASDGTQADRNNADLWRLSLSADGRYVAFASDATNLTPDDPVCSPHTEWLGCAGIFVHDRETGQTERVSVASDGTPANCASDGASMSDDGRYVVFHSLASNLAPGSLNDCLHSADIYLHDRETGTTERVSVPSDDRDLGSYSPSISPDGRFVAFDSSLHTMYPDEYPINEVDGIAECAWCREVFVFDRTSDTVERATFTSGGEYDRLFPDVSADGGQVAFSSVTNNLVPADVDDGADVFVQSLDELVIG